MNSEKLSMLLHDFEVTDFTGFSFAIFDCPDRKETSNQEVDIVCLVGLD